MATKPMTLGDLTVNFGNVNRESLLSDWVWLIGESKVPILISVIGDAFLEDTHDGTVYHLEVAAGQISRVADNIDTFKMLLADREFVVSRFAVEMVADLRNNGVVLMPGEVYSFRKPPILGGDYAFENVEKVNLEVHFSLMGQIHKQVATLPHGKSVSHLRLE